MAVRRVSNRGGNVIGRFPSLKANRMVMFESLIEWDFLYVLDYEPSIESFEEQPLTIPYTFQDRPHTYTPDFHIVQAGQDILAECKPAARVDQADNQRKFEAARDWCAARGWSFWIVTDQQLRSGYRLENIKRLTFYARHTISPQLRAGLFALLQPTSQSIRALSERMPSETYSMVAASLLHMAFHQEVTLALDSALISDTTQVSLYHPSVFPWRWSHDR